jgi:hypothetical protein
MAWAWLRPTAVPPSAADPEGAPLEETEPPELPLLAAVVTWTVALSVSAHGLTAGPAASRYAGWYAARHEHHGACPQPDPGS